MAAATGVSTRGAVIPLTEPGDVVVRALEEHEPVAESGERLGGALLAVPLLVRGEAYGVLALEYRQAREFGDLDVRLAASFGAEVAMAIENARLRDEIRRSAAATERSRLARDLHDSVTQSLFAASLKAEAIRRRWEPTTEEARTNVEDVERLARGALAEMRYAAHGDAAGHTRRGIAADAPGAALRGRRRQLACGRPPRRPPG